MSVLLRGLVRRYAPRVLAARKRRSSCRAFQPRVDRLQPCELLCAKVTAPLADAGQKIELAAAQQTAVFQTKGAQPTPVGGVVMVLWRRLPTARWWRRTQAGDKIMKVAA